MRDKFWKLYERVMYVERYYWHYRRQSILIDKIIQVILIASGLSGVAGIWLWAKYPHSWAFVAMIAQIIGAVSCLTPWSDQVKALNFLLPELDLLQNRVDHDWDELTLSSEMTDCNINDLVLRYANELAQLEHKYTGGLSFRPRKSVERLAQIDCEKQKFSHLDVTQVDHLDITQENHLEEVLKNGR